MNHHELRKKFIEFYKKQGHQEIGQAALVPQQDASVLFTTAGMHPLIPFLMGDTHPDGSRLVNIQRCLRTGDIEEVGDATHNTFFEMLGHWSLGDYFKHEAIDWSYKFVTEELGIPKEKLAVTVFAGDKLRGVGLDEEAKQRWQSLGMERIDELVEDNWWGPVHSSGPCGPTTEIFVWSAEAEIPPNSLPGNDERWVEIWNNVFMEFNKTEDGQFEPLDQKNIDTGVGLERVLMTVNNYDSVYQTDVLAPIVAAISTDQLAHADRDVRILADHIRAAFFMIADGVLPSNKDRGYVLRRLIRRAVQAARKLDFTDWPLLTEAILGVYGPYYPQLLEQEIEAEILAEQQKFTKQLTKAVNFIEKAVQANQVVNDESAANLAFLAYQSHALPLELGYEILTEAGLVLGRKSFEQALDQKIKAHQEVSRAGSEKKFGGHGLILDTGELKASDETELKKVLRLHTATHILQASLRAVLGDQITQKGSDINADRLRFDFNYPDKLTAEQKAEVEAWANKLIEQGLPMNCVELSLVEAKKTGALHFFDHKYPDKVKVHYLGDSISDAPSKEFCGGPHVSNTNEIGKLKIIKEQSAGAGIRRIKAIVED
ncbi:alanine--tRNA ligase [Candidatus Berkelbacteria bacterium]|nr:alanine--tRNA ligase [Candidatus Berkelbacteria bacterium]